MTDIIKANNKLDDYGKLTESMPSNAPKYNFKLMTQYCNEKNKSLSELTQEEIEQFRNN